MAAGRQLVLCFVACLVACCADAEGPPNTTGIPTAADPDAERNATLPNATDEPTTPDGRDISYACPGWRNNWHACESRSCADPIWKDNYCQCDPLCVTYGDCCSDREEHCGVIPAGVGSTDWDRSASGENIGQGLSTNSSSRLSSTVGSSSTDLSSSALSSEATASPSSVTTEGKSDYRGSSTDGNLTKCIQTVQFDPEGPKPRSGYWLVADCPRKWTGGASVRNLCKDTVGMDGLAAVPVVGTDRRHYRNVYCAICHGLSHTNVTFWSVFYQNQFRLHPTQVLQIASGQIPSDGYTKLFRPPGYDSSNSQHLAGSSLRTCVILDALSCLISDPRAFELCQTHYAPIAWNKTTYRNFACLCDGTAAHSTDTLESWCPSKWDQQRRGTLSMATLLVFSDRTDIIGDKGTVGATVGSACTHRQIYDPFSSSCRDLSCPQGFALDDGGMGCARIRETGTGSTGTTTNVEVTLTVTGSLRQNPDARNTHASAKIWEEIAQQAGRDYHYGISVCRIADEATENNGVEQENEFCGDLSVQWSCTMDVAILDSEPTCLMGRLFTCSVNVSFEITAPSVDQFIAENEMVSRQCLASKVGNHTIRPDSLAISTPCETLSNDTRHKSIWIPVSASIVAYARDNDSGQYVMVRNDSCVEVSANCPLLTFSREDYVINSALNDSIRLTTHDRVLHSGEFNVKQNGDVEVCNFLPQGAPSTPMWDYAHAILTFTGSSLSLIGVVVTIATYVAFPALRRNAAGRALMSLVGALFLAQLTMLIGLNRTDLPVLCPIFAIGSHFFWLAAFFWMNILAVDIYRTFGIGTSLSDPSGRSFLRYALYGWGAPGAIVAVVAILSFCDCVDADVSYGNAHACWVSNGTANLLSFGIPIVVIICSNAVLFSLTAAGVKRTRMASKRMNITQGQSGSAAKKPNNDIILYLKLTAIMGFTWVFGFVASFSGVELFWYIFIILNSLQGALVCLAFVGNQRVLGMWRAWLKSRRGRYLADQSDTTGSCRGQRSFKASMTEQSQIEIGTETTDM